ncbi:MAG: AlbA family DNA-binding domain-containing protein [Acidimicrobiales bacterium]
MNRLDVLELISGGEGSRVEFKRKLGDSRDFAKELVALANLAGGTLLVGVDDDRTVPGLDRSDLEAWVMEACRTKIRPPIIPYYQEVEVRAGVRVAVIEVERGYSVHSVWHNQRHTYYIRVGSTSQEARPEELARLFQQRGALRAEAQPVSGATLEHLDLRRLAEYFTTVRK